jgi:transcriptional regulator with XRE-family HTH domain
MENKAQTLRKTLSANIKKQRELAKLTQEKLAEKEGISANMINDIEGCRSWISDKTLVKLAAALQIETYRLFTPPNPNRQRPRHNRHRRPRPRTLKNPQRLQHQL